MENMNSEEFLKRFEEIQKRSFELVKIKNNGYGSSFVTDSYEGVIVRLTDKLNRLRTLSSGNEQKIKTEGMLDTLMDLHNYSIIAMICLENNIHSPLFKNNKKEK